MQARTFRDIANFDRSVAEFRAHVNTLTSIVERAK